MSLTLKSLPRKMFFSSNIRFLRTQRKETAKATAASTGITVSTLGSFEKGSREPNLNELIAVSSHFSIPVDALIRADLSSMPPAELILLQQSPDRYISGEDIRILATTVDSSNRENIELVPFKASAGYTQGYNDPQYIQSLPTFQLPFLSEDRKYRAFQIQGDSMLPVQEGSWVIGEFVQDWNAIKDGHAYILLTLNEGVVFKVVYKQLRTRKKLLMKSLNPLYEAYELDIKEVREVWRFTNYISSVLPGNGDILQNIEKESLAAGN
jgi:transcriptional regulator with XRE-family HTH domain